MADDGGRVIPDAVVDEITFKYSLASMYSTLGIPYPPKPLTRRDRLRIRYYDLRAYARHLWLAVRNDCDRGEW